MPTRRLARIVPPGALALLRRLVPGGAPGPRSAAADEACRSLIAHSLLEQGIYRNRLPPFLSDLSDTGALGVNAAWERGRADRWCLGEQRFGADLVQAGLVRRDGGLVERGWLLLRWGFERQGPDGDFPGGAGRPLHNTGFFVEAAARALRLERLFSPAGLPARQAAWGEPLRRAARWMAEVAAPEEFAHNDRMAHRWWLLAAACAQASCATGDAPLAGAAARFARRGLQRMRGDGVMPEAGGHDVRYQAMGLLYAARYALACDEPGGAAGTTAAVRRAARWLAARIQADGSLDGSGSTRYLRERTPSGHPKGIDHHRALEALVLAAGAAGDRDLLDAAARLAPHAACEVLAMGTARARPAARRHAFVFVCQAGELEPQALVLAASLRRHLRCDHELIAAVPSPAETWGSPAAETLRCLASLGVRTVEIANPVAPDFPHGNKIPCLTVATDADVVVFLDTDVLCLGDVGGPPRHGAIALKPADLQAFTCDPRQWRAAYEAAGAPAPNLDIPTSASNEFGPPFYNSGVIFVERAGAPALAAAWEECCRRIRDDARVAEARLRSDQIGLAAALAKLGTTPESLDDGFNHPVHLVRLEPGRLPRLAHYHWPEQIRQEPVLRALVRSLAAEHPALEAVLDRFPDWAHILRSGPASRPGRPPAPPELIVTGISRSGTSYLANLLHRHANCVVINEPPEIHEALGQPGVPWGMGVYYRGLRADILEGRAVRNKLVDGRVTEDTAVDQRVHAYVPSVEGDDFVLGTKNTIAYLHHLSRIRRAMPGARVAVCVRDPLDTIASWKTSFPHLAAVDFSVRRQGRPDDPWLAGALQAELREIDAVRDLAVRRARYWHFLAQRVLDCRDSVVLVRYDELVGDPGAVLARILAGWRPGRLREPVRPSPARGRRSALDPEDLRAIRAICAQSAADLGLW